MDLRRHFTEHPAKVGETWGEHCRVALGYSRDLAMAAGAAAVHAFVPSLCETTASRQICALEERLTSSARLVDAPGHVDPDHVAPDHVAPDHAPDSDRGPEPATA